MKIIDSHLHFYDNKANKHTFLDQFDLNYAAFVGDCSSMPKEYLLNDYLQDSAKYQVEGVIWHEFLSTDPIKEAKWAQGLVKQNTIRQAMVVLVDFLDPTLEEKLEVYNSLPNVTAVREHMVWDDKNLRKRFAKRPDLLLDNNWQKKLGLLNQYNFKCGLEVFSPQLKDLIKVIHLYSNIGFTIALMGWPLGLSEIEYQSWRQDLKNLSQYQNICMDISAIECIFGMDWTLEQVRPWILNAIDIFGTERCMFGSHMPIAKLSRGFTQLYSAYENIITGFSHSEKESLFYQVAKEWFRL